MKNKNKPEEDLKKIKDNYYYSESEDQLYTVTDDGEKQTPVADEKLGEIWKDIEASFKSTGEMLKKVFKIKDKKDDDSAIPFI